MIVEGVNPDKPLAIPTKEVSRRGFLRIFASAVTAVMLGKSISSPDASITPAQAPVPPTAPINPEAEKPVELESATKITVIDFFETTAFWDSVVQHGIGAADMTEAEIWKSMGVADLTESQDRLNALPQTEQQAQVLLLRYLMERYSSHGEMVKNAAAATSQALAIEPTTPPAIEVPIESALNVHSLTYDELGNPHLLLYVDAERVSNMIDSNDAQIINLSFQLGLVGAKYEMNGWVNKHDRPDQLLAHISARPKVINVQTGEVISPARYSDTATGQEISAEEFKTLENEAYAQEIAPLPPKKRSVIILDGYAREHTLENVTYLVQLARLHPEKLIVAAAGNPVLDEGLTLPDIRQARAELETEGKWAENLLVCGVWGKESDHEMPFAEGADIYVSHEDLAALGYQQASSFAAPVISAVAQTLGISNPAALKEAVLSLTKPVEIIKGDSPSKYQVLDMDTVRRKFDSKTTQGE